MKKELIEKLKNKLEKERETLEEMLKDFAKESKTNPGDWKTKFPNFKTEGFLEEEADEVEEYSSLLSIEKPLELKLQNINEALKKIKEGNYGKCEKCEKEISENRLNLIPEAKTCNDC